MTRRFRAAGVLILAAFLVWSPAALAGPLVTDDISTTDRFRYPGTSAVVDTVGREIRLPEGSPAAPGILDARPGGYELVTLNGGQVESWSYNGSGMVRNGTLTVTPATPPLAVAGRKNQTDMVTVGADGLRHYSFDGGGVTENPFLAVTGFASPVQVATRPGQHDTFVLDGTSVSAYSYDGQQMVSNPALSLSTGLTNPVAFALHPRTFDVAVVDGGDVRYFSFNGSSLAANSLFSVAGLTNPVAVQIAENGMVFVAEAGGIVAYAFDGSGMRVNSLLSVPEAAGSVGFAVLGDSNSVAVRFPTEIRVYQFDGTAMRENPALRITGLNSPPGTGSTGYLPSGVAVSKTVPVPEPLEALVLRANQVTPPGTSVRYQVSGDGGLTWLNARLGKGVLMPSPGVSGAAWRAILATSDPEQTPLVLPNVQLRQVWRPDPPSNLAVSPREPDGLVLTATPTLSWTFTDRDQNEALDEVPPGDYQTAFQVQIYDRDTGQLVFNTGKISALADADPPPDEGGPYPLSAPDFRGRLSSYTLPSGSLSAGYRFQWRVRVWDRYDLPSLWSSPMHEFEVLALDNLMVTDVVMPPGSPPPTFPTKVLPVPVKAGAEFSFSIDSIGAIETVGVTFSDDGDRTLTPRWLRGSTRNTWDGDYFTNGSVPTGSILTATFVGRRADGRFTTLISPIVVIEGSIYDDFLIILTK